jgi:hypothetical protein
MPAGEAKTPDPRAHAMTIAVWIVGVGLQLGAPLLRDRVPLSDDLFITSMVAPAWTFLQVCLLAGALRLMRRRTESWSVRRRAVAGAGVAVAFMLLQPGFVSLAMTAGAGFDWSDGVSVALLWSTPLALYVVPAGIVVWVWARGDGRVSLPRALGYGLVAQGVLNLGFILWLTHLWELYSNSPQSAVGP